MNLKLKKEGKEKQMLKKRTGKVIISFKLFFRVYFYSKPILRHGRQGLPVASFITFKNLSLNAYHHSFVPNFIQ